MCDGSSQLGGSGRVNVGQVQFKLGSSWLNWVWLRSGINEVESDRLAE